MSTELVVAEKFELEDASDFASVWREEMGDEAPPIARIKTPSGGSTAWEVAGDDPENPDSVKELIGIVVAHHESSRTYLDSYDSRQAGDSGKPDMWSIDGKVQVIPAATYEKCKERGLPRPDTNLLTCPYNQFGSAHLLGGSGDGKATNNYREVFLYLGDGAVFPVQVSLSAASLKAWKLFSGLTVVGKYKRFTNVVVGIGLKKEKNAANKEYSAATFRVVEKLEPQHAAQMLEYSRSVKALVQNDPFAAVADSGDEAFEAAEVTQVRTPDPQVANPEPSSKEAELDAAFAAVVGGPEEPAEDEIPF